MEPYLRAHGVVSYMAWDFFHEEEGKLVYFSCNEGNPFEGFTSVSLIDSVNTWSSPSPSIEHHSTISEMEVFSMESHLALSNALIIVQSSYLS